jgi:multiple sugar transport system permease protein
MPLRRLALGRTNTFWRGDETLVALLLIAPSVIYLFVMSIYPTFYSLWLSFHNYMIFRPGTASFSGFENFSDLFDDFTFRTSLRVTVLFAFGAVTIEFVVGLAVAVLLDRKMTGIGLLRTLIIVPVLISPVGMGLTFRYIFAPSYGLLNYLLSIAGLPTTNWVADTSMALPMVIIVDVWQWSPFVTLILLSGMQSVSVEVVEAAELDGLNEWQKLWRIVIPLIMPVVTVVLLIRLIDAIRSFDLVYTMTHGGPGSATEVIGIYAYAMGFTSGDMGMASAAAWFTVVCVNVLVVLFLRILSKTQA